MTEPQTFDDLRLDDGSPLTDQEKWVLEQVEKGEVADLVLEYGVDLRPRTLRANFLEKLLIGEFKGVKVHRRGVRVAQALFSEPVDLEDAEVPFTVHLNTCTFHQEVSFRDGHFHKHLFLNGCRFSQEADFHRLRTGGNLFADSAVFIDRANFGVTDIGGQFSADGAQFQGCDEHQKANFYAIKVGQTAFLRRAVFRGPVNFGSAAIGGQFKATDARFEGAEAHQSANFNGMKVEELAFFDNARFHGPVDFRGAHIGGQFNAIGAYFKGSDPHQIANFGVMKVGHHAFFDNAVFQGPVDFGGADIGGNFNAQGVQFQGSEAHQLANFNGIKVGEGAFFNNAVFHGPVVFFSADIGAQFKAREAKFHSEAAVIWEGLQVSQGVSLEQAEFNGPLNLNDAHLLDLHLGGKPIPDLNLERTRIHRALNLKATTIDTLTARNLEVQGPATLSHITFTDEVDLREARFTQVDLVEVEWPEGQVRLYLDGLTFTSLSTKPRPRAEENWNRILTWLARARFNSQNYLQMDEYLQRSGLRSWAYKVFLAGKRRDWRRRPWWDITKWFTKIFWDWLAGYGRKPGRAFLVSLGIIILGAFIFDPLVILTPTLLKGYWLSADNFFQSVILRLILSLNYFLPAIDMGFAKEICLPNLNFGTLLYFQFHKICGWVLIPIGLAALTTKLK